MLGMSYNPLGRARVKRENERVRERERARHFIFDEHRDQTCQDRVITESWEVRLGGGFWTRRMILDRGELENHQKG